MIPDPNPVVARPGDADPTPQCAAITGASSGIGRAVSLSLAARGMRVALIGRNRERLHAVADDVVAAGGSAHVLVADLADAGQTREVGERVAAWAPALDVLVHSAGLAVGVGPRSPEADRFDEQVAVNLRAPMLLTAALAMSLDTAAGTVIVLNSSAALRSAPVHSTYAGTKTALRAWTDALREELGGRGVRICSIYPGRVATPMQERLQAEAGKLDAYRPKLLLQPEDVARVVAFVIDQPPHLELTDISVRPSLRTYSSSRPAAARAWAAVDTDA